MSGWHWTDAWTDADGYLNARRLRASDGAVIAEPNTDTDILMRPEHALALAAAPELLEALRIVRKHIGGWVDYSPGRIEPGGPSWSDWERLADAAIAKAEPGEGE